MLLGALLNLIKGCKDYFKAKSEENKLSAELSNDFWSGFTRIQKFEASSSLLLAESMILLEKSKTANEKIEILERVLIKMNELISNTEEELKKISANKLDIATLAVNIQDLTINTIKEIEKQYEALQKQTSKNDAVDERLEQLSNEILKKTQNKAIPLLEEKTSRLINHTQTIEKNLSESISNTAVKLKEVNTAIEKLTDQVSSVKDHVTEQVSTLTNATTSLDNRLINLRNDLSELKNETQNLKTEISSDLNTIDANLQQLTKNLKNFKDYTEDEFLSVHKTHSNLRERIEENRQNSETAVREIMSSLKMVNSKIFWISTIAGSIIMSILFKLFYKF